MTKNPNATDVHVGRRMRMRRLMLQMSQEMFAAKLGVTFQQVQKYEKGVNRVSASRLQQACNVLQVPVQFFFDGLPKTETGTRRREDTSYALISNLLSSSEGIALAKQRGTYLDMDIYDEECIQENGRKGTEPADFLAHDAELLARATPAAS